MFIAITDLFSCGLDVILDDPRTFESFEINILTIAYITNETLFFDQVENEFIAASQEITFYLSCIFLQKLLEPPLAAMLTTTLTFV